ncbi:MAG: GNAT family N-acetyltransferase [Phycisphaerales bacterium]|nr:GNAT family N-acetyltransferase [Phycisphaerales bacterium]
MYATPALEPNHGAPRLRTARLDLIAGTAAMNCADAAPDRPQLGDLLDADIAEDWPPELMRDVLSTWANIATERPAEIGWWNWYIIRDEAGPHDRILVGGAGFKGPPDEDGWIEVGYSILPSWQCKGFATEAVAALLAWAWQHPQVTYIAAETLPYLSAALRVLSKLGFEYAGDGSEPGAVRFKLARPR